MINRRLIQELRQDMKSTREFRGLDLSPRNVRQYLASKILNEMIEKEKTGGRSRRISLKIHKDGVDGRMEITRSKDNTCWYVTNIESSDTEVFKDLEDESFAGMLDETAIIDELINNGQVDTAQKDFKK